MPKRNESLNPNANGLNGARGDIRPGSDADVGAASGAGGSSLDDSATSGAKDSPSSASAQPSVGSDLSNQGGQAQNPFAHVPLPPASGAPSSIPAASRDGKDMSTPWSPLMHEVAMAPAAVLVPARRLLQQVAYLCKNSADAAHATVFFFAIRVASRIQGFAQAALGLPPSHPCSPLADTRDALEMLSA